jgi:uncharacterized alpha-E superfamily protein
MDFAAFVRSSLETGNTPEQVAKALIDDHHLLPISAIKALRSGGDMTLVEAKELIRGNLPVETWVAAERLWDEIVAHQERADGDI